MIRILIANDEGPVRRQVSAWIAQQSDMIIVGEAADGKAAVKLARTTHPDVVVMDVDMPVMNGIDASRIIKSEGSACRIVGFSRAISAGQKRDFTKAGAETWVSRSKPMRALVDTIRGGR